MEQFEEIPMVAFAGKEADAFDFGKQLGYAKGRAAGVREGLEKAASICLKTESTATAWVEIIVLIDADAEKDEEGGGDETDEA